MSLKNIRKIFWSKKVFLFDLDGTLYLGNKLIPGALNLLHELHLRNKKVFYFTNNSSRSEVDYSRKLKAFGFPVQAGQIIMSTHSLITKLKRDRRNKVFLLGTPAMKKMLRASNIELISEKPQAVVVGFDKTLTYAKLEHACRLVAKGIPYYVTHPDFFCPTEKGPEPDCGAFALVIEKATKKKPIAVLGKPNPLMIQEVRRRIHVKASDMILIGDRLMTDILMAHKAGIQSLLVLSGDSTKTELRSSSIKPTGLISSVKALLE